MINDKRINELVETLAREGTPEERLLLVDALTRLPISQDVWRRAAAPILEFLSQLIESREATGESLTIFSRVPLMSVRAPMRRTTLKPESPLAIPIALALAAQHDAAALEPLIEALKRSPSEPCARAIACIPANALPPFAGEIESALANPDPMVRLWAALALAKAFRVGDGSRNLEPLEQLWDSLVRPTGSLANSRRTVLFAEPPPLFWGDPWVAAGSLAALRPLPEATKNFLIGLKTNDFEDWTPRSEDSQDARNAKILIAGLTGEYDIYGDRTPEAPTPESSPAETTAQGATQSARAAKVIERALLAAPRRPAGDSDTGAAVTSGNELLDLVTALPSTVPLDVPRILAELPRDSALPDNVIAWVLARTGGEALWESFAPALRSKTGTERRESLKWLRDIASQIHASAPYQGSGGDSGAEPAAQEPIDDLQPTASRGATFQRSRPAPAEAQPTMRGHGPSEARASAPAAAPPPAPPPAPDGFRHIQANLHRWNYGQWERMNDAILLVNRPHQISIFIGPFGAATFRVTAPFPDEKLDWKSADRLTLQIVFTVLDGRNDARIVDITLPRSGTSTTAEFEFGMSKPGKFRMRIVVMHAGRIVQTALLSATAVETLSGVAPDPDDGKTEREVVVYEDLESLQGRRPFDASLLLNHTEEGDALATTAAGDSAYIASLDASQGALSDISQLLQEIADKSKLHTRKLRSKENAAWLAALAQYGTNLFDNLVTDYLKISVAAERLRDARYLQIVTSRPDAIVPLEFVYEYKFPDDDAQICDGAEEALAKRKCPMTCQNKDRNSSAYVCPFGFWGLSRVIERHLHNPQLGSEAKVTISDNTPSRKQLVLRGPSLLAASKQVPPDRVAALGERLAKFSPSGVSTVSSWKDWLLAVKKQPILFVVLPHASGEGAGITLEISGNTIKNGQIAREYIYPIGSTGSPPIVLLLGCNTAGVAEMKTYAKHITKFRQAESAIVLATTAAVVWGEDIAEVAEILVEQLQNAAKNSDQHFGEILRDAKCQAVLESQLVAICLAAIGDADWRITIPKDN